MFPSTSCCRKCLRNSKQLLQSLAWPNSAKLWKCCQNCESYSCFTQLPHFKLQLWWKLLQWFNHSERRWTRKSSDWILGARQVKESFGKPNSVSRKQIRHKCCQGPAKSFKQKCSFLTTKHPGSSSVHWVAFSLWKVNLKIITFCIKLSFCIDSWH